MAECGHCGKHVKGIRDHIRSLPNHIGILLTLPKTLDERQKYVTF